MSAESPGQSHASSEKVDTILFLCSGCSTELEAPLAEVNSNVTCQGCGQTSILPLPVIGLGGLEPHSRRTAAASASNQSAVEMSCHLQADGATLNSASLPSSSRTSASVKECAVGASHINEIQSNSVTKILFVVVVAALVGWAAFTTVKSSKLSEIQVEDQIVTSFDLISKRRDKAALRTTKVVRDLMPALIDIKKGGSQEGRDVVTAAILKTIDEANETRAEMAHLMSDCASLCLQYPQIAVRVLDETISTEQTRGNLAYSELMKSFRNWLSHLPENKDSFHIFFLEQLSLDANITPPDPEIY